MNRSKAEPNAPGAVEPTWHHQPHRRHRHKRFRVRPEAVGIGYETSRGWPEPFSGASTHLVAPDSISEAEDFREPDAQPAAVPSSAKPEPLSEKEIARSTALKGIRTCLILLACVFALAFVRAHFDSFKALGSWLLARMPQPIVYEHPTDEVPPRN